MICVTPVRNEAWTLERFLRSAEQWADHIVLGDQQSTDATREIAARFPKVRVVENTDTEYHEGNYRKLILDAARQIPGPRAIIAIDADEALSAQVLGSAEWERALREPPGTVLSAWWVNYLPDWTRAWIPERIPIGLIDDGREHNPGRFHAKRFIVRPEDRQVELDDVKVLHFQYTAWRRMKSKQRRYQVAERLAGARPISLYRRFHRMDAVPSAQTRPAESSWIDGYEAVGIPMRTVDDAPIHWWDEELLEIFLTHGTRRFRRLDLWDVDWQEVAERLGRSVPSGTLADPRTPVDKLIIRWLEATQRRRPSRRRVRWFQRALIPFGW